MEIAVSFYNGPLDGTSAMTDGLTEAKIFFNERERQVLLYVRVDELKYAYSMDRSEALTERYDEAKAFFASKEPASLRFIDAGEESED